MNAKLQDRINRLMPGGKPRYIRCYDAPEYGDRYTVVYTGRNPRFSIYGRRYFVNVGMSAYPYHPQGICQHEETDELIDRPTYSHLGKKISFDDLPEDCKKVVIRDYMYFWDLTEDTTTGGK